MGKRLSQAEVIQKATVIHNNKYDYSLLKFINTSTKVIIICPTHGQFEQTPNNHLAGKGCIKCRFLKKSITHGTLEKFIEKANQIHFGKYSYTKYINAKTKIEIECPDHGTFMKTPDNHVNLKQRCPKCANLASSTKQQKPFSQFVEESNIVHNFKYDYTLAEPVYNGGKYKIPIICPKHGIFTQKTQSHMKFGCMKCGKDVLSDSFRMSIDDLIARGNEKHNNKYDYSLIHLDYINQNSRVTIMCPIHGEFKQRISTHFNAGCGCQKCSSVSNGEDYIRTWLQTHNISFTPQKRFPDCKHIKHLPFDFHLPEHNICIEFDGILHHRPHIFNKADATTQKKIDAHEFVKFKDNIKTKYCIDNNIKLLRISEIKRIDEILATEIL